MPSSGQKEITFLQLFKQPAFVEQLCEEVLPAYLPQQRWFTSKGKALRTCRIQRLFSLGQQWGILLLSVDFADGSTDLYQLPLAYLHSEADLQYYQQTHPGLVLAPFGEPAVAILADAVALEGFRNQLFQEMQTQKQRNDGLFYDAGKLLQTANIQSLSSRVPAIDTSNTAIIYNDAFFFKLFRKVDSGLNPDLELTRFLSEQANFTHSPAYGGSLSVGQMGQEEDFINLGMMIAKIDNRGDAWSLFQEYAMDYYHRVYVALQHVGDLRVPTFALPASYSELPKVEQQMISEKSYRSARLLGTRTAQMHLALAGAAATSPALLPAGITEEKREAIFLAAKKLVDRQFDELAQKRSGLPPKIQALADDILGRQAAVMQRLAAFVERKVPALLSRIHGDYHLGQVLAMLDDDFCIIDFEGEPLLSIPERQQKRPPFKDVAGMIRSFHYAAQGALLLNDTYSDAELERLQPWGDWWFRQMRHSFLLGYLHEAKDAPFVPHDARDREDLLDFFVLEKAVYEVAYELNSRPHWLPIPLQGMRFALLDDVGV